MHLSKWWYNTTNRISGKMNPFQALYGYEPSKSKEFSLNESKVKLVNNHLGESQNIIRILKDNLKPLVIKQNNNLIGTIQKDNSRKVIGSS